MPGLAPACRAIRKFRTMLEGKHRKGGPTASTTALVAVDSDVYLVEGFDLWNDVEHSPSRGRARCGLGLTEFMDESPHERSKLPLLDKVGTLDSARSAIPERGRVRVSTRALRTYRACRTSERKSFFTSPTVL